MTRMTNIPSLLTKMPINAFGPNRRTRGIVLGLTCALTTVAACGEENSRRVLFGGYYFPSKAAAVDKKVTRADFTVTVNKATQSVEDAREAGRYAGTRYCIENYGTSQIDWRVGPDADPAQLRVVDDKLSFSGVCKRP